MPDGSPASVSDAGTWSSFEECWGRQDGAGFVLGGGVACVDLDDCFVSGGGLSDVAVGVLGLCEGAFVERSWSGRGLHVWGVCSERVGRVCAGYECYSRGRFIMVTGRVFSRGGLGVDLSRFWGELGNASANSEDVTTAFCQEVDNMKIVQTPVSVALII
jgi:primase-polymerase (primpol)-like protein